MKRESKVKLANRIAGRLLPEWLDTELPYEKMNSLPGFRDGYAVAVGYLTRRLARMPRWWLSCLVALVFGMPAKDVSR